MASKAHKPDLSSELETERRNVSFDMGDYNDRSPSKDALGLFDKSLKFLVAELPKGIVRGKSSITPVNLYEAVIVGTALALASGNKVKKGVLKRLLDNSELKKLTTGGTNSRKMVVGRIEFVRDRLV